MRSVREAIEKSDAEIRFAAIFGSYPKSNRDIFSDLDLLVVCEDQDDTKIIRGDMLRLGDHIGREIHLNYYNLDEFDRRLKYQDYKLASILQNAQIIIDDGDFNGQLKHLIGNVRQDSIKFNEAQALKTLNKALENLRNYNESVITSSHNPESWFQTRYFQTQSIRNSHLALGYKLASKKMKQTGKMTTLNLLISEDTPLLKELISVDRSIKRRQHISFKNTKKYLLKVLSNFTKQPL